MSSSADLSVATYDGVDGDALAARLRVPRAVVFAQVGSTLDVAHSLGSEGTPGGTLVVADEQTAGRGRHGRTWHSEPGQGIWLTLVERPRDLSGLDVLSLRIGLAAARALDAFADARVGIKWPNDLYVGGRKLAGVLIEARWRNERLDHVAIGFGLNVRPPSAIDAASLSSGTARLDVLDALVPAMRNAAMATGALGDAELAELSARDTLRGRAIVEPAQGIVAGVAGDGTLTVRTAGGDVSVRAGSITLAEDA